MTFRVPSCIQTYEYNQTDLAVDVNNRYAINPVSLTHKYLLFCLTQRTDQLKQ
jgi:hypothetical protein